MLEAVAIAISAIALLLSRLDLHKSNVEKGLDVRAALVELDLALQDWVSSAQLTNQNLRKWWDSAMPEVDADDMATRVLKVSVTRQPSRGIASQRRFIETFRVAFEGTSVRRWGKKSNQNLSQLLRVYAPEVRNDLVAALGQREVQVAQVLKHFKSRAFYDEDRSFEDYFEELDQSLDALRETESNLRSYIQSKFPIGQGR